MTVDNVKQIFNLVKGRLIFIEGSSNRTRLIYITRDDLQEKVTVGIWVMVVGSNVLITN